MTKIPVRSPDRLHPNVYYALIGLAALYVVSAWIGFAGSGYTDYLLMIMTGFIAVSVILPLSAWHTRHAYRQRTGQDKGRKVPRFKDWKSEEIGIDRGRMSGADATLEILLPIAAVAFGMLAFAILARLLG
ncbi:hypothetical protein ACFWXH_19870 [Mesorhizobium sp. NPDC059054]|uniref:hypothetical protein n=1 Tax=unclassified Mesorhizobium TaxID=325217 RepID=UPI0006C754CA|nr:hypothetical protein [Mesorhizobium sp. 1M-11]